jgi:alkanesulfonate monooxygenase SsuD/methylene tetrahydromethanopterin reductase-like flavin-dependent oxidoreductase (luciferase family)
MDFGIFLDFPVQGGTHENAFKETFELVDLAEETGLDTVWLGETHFTPQRAVHSAQMVIMSSIATRTKRLRVGSAVHVLPLIHPLRIAEEAATVDQISEGRFEFGAGRSGNIRAYDTMGIDYLESKDRFQEALEIILQAWSGETFSYEGKYNHITDATLTPLPYQKPHPKVRIASSGEDSFSRVGRLGFPIFLSMRGMDVNELENNLKEYHKAWKEAGHPGEAGDVSVRFPMYIAPKDEDAIQEPKETIERYFQRMRERFQQGRFEEALANTETGPQQIEDRRARLERLESMTYQDILDTKVIVGSPERVIDQLTQYKEMLGLTGFTAELNPGGTLPKEVVQRSLKLLTQEVMPAFK